MKIKLFLPALFIVFFAFGCASSDSLQLKTKTDVQQLNQVAEIGTKVGNTPADFTLVATDGKIIRLSDFAAQKKPVIVYFMATWCPYCAQDYSELSKVYPNYENNISIVSISLDLSEDIIKIREYKKKYPALQNTVFAPGQEKILADYGATKTTKKFAIGSDGTIKFVSIGVFDEQQWKILLGSLADKKSKNKPS